MFDQLLPEFAPLLLAMGVLAGCSAFFSCSEAALFYLQPEDRRALKQGNTSQRVAIDLLARPDRLLTAILFWNLIINVIYFAISAVVSIQLEEMQRRAEAGIFALVSLLLIILLSEMMPKTIAVFKPRTVASIVSLPLAASVRVFDPMAPVFNSINNLLRRLIFPGVVAEPYVEISDLERAISLSTADEKLAARERTALQSIVSLSEIQAEELMRPRVQYQSYRPPVNLDDLGGQLTPSGYLLVSELDSDEVASAIALKQLPTIPRQNLENFAQPVVYVPWCSSVASILELLSQQQREVAAVVNELGETVGIVTLDDILATVFEDQSSRSERLLEKSSIQQVADNRWQVTGITSLRRLGRYFRVALPSSKSTTVAGILQELLQRLPEKDDQVDWHVFRFRVLDVSQQGPINVELQLDRSAFNAP